MEVIRIYAKLDSVFGMHNIEMNYRPKTELRKIDLGGRMEEERIRMKMSSWRREEKHTRRA